MTEPTMTDKEVGKLWVQALLYKGFSAWANGQIALIRKLVEERAQYRCLVEPRDTTAANAPEWWQDKAYWIQLALRDFGIDPATWPREVA